MMTLKRGAALTEKFHLYESGTGIEQDCLKLSFVMVVGICGRRRMGATIDCYVSFRYWQINENGIV